MSPARRVVARLAAGITLVALLASGLAGDEPPRPPAGQAGEQGAPPKAPDAPGKAPDEKAKEKPPGKGDPMGAGKPLRLDPQFPPLPLSLRQAIALSLAHNLDIKIEAYNPLSAAQDVVEARSVFDPLFFAGTTWNESRELSASSKVSGGPPTRSHTLHVESGLKKLTITGAAYQIKFSTDQVEDRTSRSSESSLLSSSSSSSLSSSGSSTSGTLNPTWTSRIEFSVTQPLWRKFGPVYNSADTLIAQNARDSSLYKFQETVIEVAANVELRYWDLVFARENLRVKQASLELAQDLLRITKAKVEAGDLAQIDILQSETNVAQREEEIIVAENQVHDAEDALKNLIKPLDDDLLMKTEIVPTEPLPELESLARFMEMDLAQALQRAMQRRPEIYQSRTLLNTQHLRLLKAKHDLWPKLDFTGKLEFSGLDDRFHGANEELGEFRFYDWSVGLVLEIPLGNRAARAAYQKALLAQAQSEASLKKIERNIVLEVRVAHRGIASTLKRIRASAKSVNLASRQLDAERKKFDVGLSTLFRVKEFIEDLIQARTTEVRAKVDFLQAFTRMRKAESTTLERLAEQGILVLARPEK